MTTLYFGFGPAAILIMLLTLIIAEMAKKYSHRKKQHEKTYF